MPVAGDWIQANLFRLKNSQTWTLKAGTSSENPGEAAEPGTSTEEGIGRAYQDRFLNPVYLWTFPLPSCTCRPCPHAPTGSGSCSHLHAQARFLLGRREKCPNQSTSSPPVSPRPLERENRGSPQQPCSYRETS